MGDRIWRAGFSLMLGVKALLRPTAFGVMAAVFDDEGRVLLVRQSYAPGWRLPGGGVGRGEPPEQAVMRELAEEVGLSGGAAALVGLYARRAGPVSAPIAFYRVTGASIAFRPNWEVREILFADPRTPPPGTARGTLRRLAELSGAQSPSRFW